MSSNNKISRRALIASAGAVPLVSSCGYIHQYPNLEANANVVRQQIFAQHPNVAKASQNATATLLFPEVVKAGFGLGGAYGDGVMYVNNKVISRYNLTAATYGIQAGIESFSLMMMFMNPKSLQDFNRYLGFDFGADVEYALPRSGINYGTSASALVHDVYALIFYQAGIMAGASLQGAKYTKL